MALSVLDREIPPLSAVAIVGRSRSGRSTLLRTLAAEAGATVLASPRAWGKTRPQDVGRRGKDGASRLAEALDATGLRHDRAQPIATLGPSGAILAELASASLGDEPILFVDDLFDRLDPWRRTEVRDHLKRRATVVFATHALDFAGTCDLVAVVADRLPIFFGSPEELVSTEPVQRFEVETSRGGAVAALVAPLAVDVTEEGDRLVFRARQGQEAAVRLLLAGYGDVRSFVTRTPSFAEAVASRLGQS